MKWVRCVFAARRVLALLGFASTQLPCVVGQAHTGEYLRSLALHPTNPQLFALRYEAGLGGVLFSRDGGKSLQIVPGQSFYFYPLRRHVPMLMAGDGKLQLALDDELRVDDGTGCSLAHAEATLDKAWITDLARHPGDPNSTFLITTADGQPRHAGLWQRDAQGMLTPLGASDVVGATLGEVPFRPTSLEVIARAASVGGLRFVEAGLAADPALPSHGIPELRVSDDMGMSWTVHTIPDHGSYGMPQLLVVSQAEPFQALVAIEVGLGEDVDDPYDPIYLTKDSGQTFTPYLDTVQVSGEAVLLPSGQILLGDRGLPGGLWSAASFDSAPSKIQDVRVGCLGYQATTQKIFMCTRHELGLYDALSNTFCALFHLTDTNAFVSCPAAPLEQHAKATKQLCDAYCSPQHYAAAPVCTMFTPGSGSLCGAAARAYDADIGYFAPAGSGTPRCTGFPGAAPDAGTATVDAGGVDLTDAGDAGDGEQAEDPGPEATEEDASDSEGLSDDAPQDDDDASDESEDTKKKKKHRGCHCTVADTHDARVPLALALAFALAFYLRRLSHRA